MKVYDNFHSQPELTLQKVTRFDQQTTMVFGIDLY